LDKLITVFVDPEPAGYDLYYHLKFYIADNIYHLVMFKAERGDGEIVDREEQDKYQGKRIG